MRSTKLYLTNFLVLCIALFANTFSPVGLAAASPESSVDAADADVVRDVQQLLSTSNFFDSANLLVTSESAVVTLGGQAKSLAEKRRATMLAKQAKGVRAVINQMTIDAGDYDDETIGACVRRELTVNEVTEKQAIAVAVENGIVGLTGNVQSLAAKRIAEDRAASVPGATDVINQLAIDFEGSVSDQELETKINSLIKSSASMLGADVEVDVNGGMASARGKTATAWQIDLVERFAEAPGVLEVSVAGVEVDPTAKSLPLRNPKIPPVGEQPVSDAELLRSVRIALSLHPVTLSYADAIEVSVDDAEVTLAGTVSRLHAKKIADQLARNTYGVRHVFNQISVDWQGSALSDSEILLQAEAAIARNVYLEPHDIRVRCKDAHLHLYGVVDTELEKQEAEKTCHRLQGVVHVANMLAVAGEWEQQADAVIEAKLDKLLRSRFATPSTQVRGTVEQGVAILRGQVDSWLQWQAALDLALEAGARKPHAMIEVAETPGRDTDRVFVPR